MPLRRSPSRAPSEAGSATSYAGSTASVREAVGNLLSDPKGAMIPGLEARVRATIADIEAKKAARRAQHAEYKALQQELRERAVLDPASP